MISSQMTFSVVKDDTLNSANSTTTHSLVYLALGIPYIIQTKLMLQPDMGEKNQCGALVLDADVFEHQWQAN
jgi:hypothetical protein